jgi:hypothetical protein
MPREKIAKGTNIGANLITEMAGCGTPDEVN